MGNFYYALSSTKGPVVLHTAKGPEIISQVAYSYSSYRGKQFDHVSDIISDNPGFDNTFTVFTNSSDLYNALISGGFSGAYLISTGERITMSNGSYLTLNSSGRLEYCTQDGVMQTSSVLGDRAMMFRSPPKSTVDIQSSNPDVLAVAQRGITSGIVYSSTFFVEHTSHLYISGVTANPTGSQQKIIFYAIASHDSLESGLPAWYDGLVPDRTGDYAIQTIPVNWPRPGDGKLLSATFEINVGPGEN